MTISELINIVTGLDRAVAKRVGAESGEFMTSGYIGGLEAMETFDPSRGASERSWVSGSVYRKMLDENRLYHGRAKSGRQRTTSLTDSFVIVRPLDRLELDDEIKSAAGGDARSEAIIRGRIAGLTDKEVGLRLGVSESRVCQLRRRLKARFATFTTAAATPRVAASTSPARKRRSGVSA